MTLPISTFLNTKPILSGLKWHNLPEYLKAMNAVPYVLADSNHIQKLSLTAQERQQKISEKIRLNSNLEDMLLQLAMFDQVNAPYLQQTVLGQATTTEDATEQVETTQDTSAKESAEDYLKHNETAEDYGMGQKELVGIDHFLHDS